MKKCLIGGIALVAHLLVVANASAESVAGFSSGGYIYPTYNEFGVALLDSFYFRYNDADHHLQSLSVKPEPNGTMILAFADHNNDDDYYYAVEHKRRTDSGIIIGSFVDFCNGSCLNPLGSPGQGYVFAIRGFRFYYRGDDHHMKWIEIRRVINGVRTSFRDKNGDDPYVVYVDYAWLPPSMVESTGLMTGTDDGGGVQRSESRAGQAVISGFRVGYTSSDHHIKEFGVLTRTSDIQVFYGDKNGDDDFSYRVYYTILR